MRDLDFFLTSASGRRCTALYLSQLWAIWRDGPEAAPLKGAKLTVHGLRATAVADRRRAGTEDGAIADEIGMSVGMVTRYVRLPTRRRRRALVATAENKQRPDLKTPSPH